ncbi:MAG: hypothetical protein AVDCRST_MAG87-2508 [uncultured Thermomicrobiales bacterium]|uniref:Uncharacterized protein n=1 Tax=uncultured Thermomicrobiales bacterium TaxID=1645740 RepID=A0A6J4VEX8_9BACT|nr:MAG: hypothetical protein AVDCRST_MAG87-2508 [uncultured Thermomicrobiales bacterium]
MFNVCAACGSFNAEHDVRDGEPGWGTAVCPDCGAGERFRRLPLFVVTGPSGAGKTTTCRLLTRTLPECVVLESDILWGAIDMSGHDGLGRYWNAWLRLVVNIHQAGRSVVLCGTVVPSLMESRPSRRFFSATHYAALTCDDAELERRLRGRPEWRGCDDAFIAEHLSFNRWFRSNPYPDQPPIELIDTTHATVEESAEAVRRWVRSRL